MGGSVQLPTPGSVRLPRGWVSSVADPGQLGCRIANGSALIVIEQERDGEMDVVIVDGGDTYHPHDANIIEAVINNDPRYVNDQISMDDIWSIIGVATESDPNLSQRFSQAFIEFSRYAPLAVGLSVAKMIRNSSGTASGIPPRGARQIAMEARNFQEQQLLTGNRPVLSDEYALTNVISAKIERQLQSRGWNQTDIDATVNNPFTTRDATNRRSGNPATAYFNQDGSYVVRDNITSEIVQISNRFIPWIPDATIINPYIP
jgi:hypothetical protein